MSITVHSSPPVRIVAGDAFLWRDSPPNIESVTGYVVVFRSLADSDNSFTITGSDETTYFEFQIAEDDTASLSGGDYSVTALVTYSWGRETDELSGCYIAPNPTADPTKSHTQKMVDFLKAHLEGRMPEGLESHTIGGVPIDKIPIPEAKVLLDRYQGELRRERQKEVKLKNPDRASGNSIHIHF